MPNSYHVSETGQKILSEVLESLKDSDDPLESHLPKEVFDLDKATLLAVLYRTLAKIPS
jgi:hypothetical protein